MTGVTAATDGASAAPGRAARARLARYARYQLTDYLVERGISTAVLGAVIVLAPLLLGGAAARESAPLLFADAVARVGLLATLFALNGISSIDRQRGYFRFLFAKPVSVPRFYAQDYLVRFAGVLAISSGLFAAFAALVGGVGFLLSALTHHDGIALVVVYVAATLVRAGTVVLAAGTRGAQALGYVSGVLPPFYRLDALRDALAAGTAPSTADLVWVLAYGLGCLAAGLLVLRHRPLSS